MIPHSVPELFAMAHGVALRRGDQRCFYCCAPCDESFTTKDYVKKSFTSRDTVGGGDYVCCGCVTVLNEKARIELADGSSRDSQKIRCYSWLITKEKAVAATKAHRAWILEQCLSPPEPPYAMVISDSGQKHLLYRGVVSYVQDPAVVSLEGEVIDYGLDEFKSRLDLCRKIAAALGKPALSKDLGFSQLIKLAEYYEDELLPYSWLQVCGQPLTRLSIWLVPPKEECVKALELKGQTL